MGLYMEKQKIENWASKGSVSGISPKNLGLQPAGMKCNCRTVMSFLFIMYWNIRPGFV